MIDAYKSCYDNDDSKLQIIRDMSYHLLNEIYFEEEIIPYIVTDYSRVISKLEKIKANINKHKALLVKYSYRAIEVMTEEINKLEIFCDTILSFNNFERFFSKVILFSDITDYSIDKLFPYTLTDWESFFE